MAAERGGLCVLQWWRVGLGRWRGGGGNVFGGGVGYVDYAAMTADRNGTSAKVSSDRTMVQASEGAAALARAKQRREEAMAEQQARLSSEAAEIAKNAERAKEHGTVEKTAGESGAAGNLQRKWKKWLQSPHGLPVVTVTSLRRSG